MVESCGISSVFFLKWQTTGSCEFGNEIVVRVEFDKVFDQLIQVVCYLYFFYLDSARGFAYSVAIMRPLGLCIVGMAKFHILRNMRCYNLLTQTFSPNIITVSTSHS